MNCSGQNWGSVTYEAELYRLKGTLTLQSEVPGLKSEVEEGAEKCFHQAIEIAQRQSAKSLELRAVMSLVRLRQQQSLEHESRTMQHGTHPTHDDTHAKLTEAHSLLSNVYNWFTEGFETKNLKVAKALLDELS